MQTSQAIQAYLQAVPKAELHVHLEGSIRPETLLTLAQRNGVELPASDVAELRQWFAYRDFNHFVEIFFAVSRCLKTAEDYELIAYEFGAEMARQNVRYAEVTFSASTHRYSLGIPYDTYFSGLNKGRERARTDFGVEMRWVFDIVRDVKDASESYGRADFTTQVAIECMQDGVIALGLGGNEVGYPPERFANWFEKALAAGLHSTPHAGETVGPASVWGALHTLGAERIGHGVRSVEDKDLVVYLSEKHIPLEICPGSNICLGVYASLAEHPLPYLYSAGVPFSINSDDPPLVNTTLNDDIGLLYRSFHFDLATIDEIVLNGVRHSFMPSQQKLVMEEEFRATMTRLHRVFGLLNG
jgi:adenosine deaminase